MVGIGFRSGHGAKFCALTDMAWAERVKAKENARMTIDDFFLIRANCDCMYGINHGEHWETA